MSNRKRTIHLHGRLGELYGDTVELAVDTPVETIRALSIIYPDFKDEFESIGHYKFERGSGLRKLALSEKELTLRFGKERDFHIIPLPVMSGPAIFLGLTALQWIGAGLAVAAVATLAFMKIPTMPSAMDREKDERKSAIFSGPLNVTEQGHPVPVCIGKVLAGSVIGSFGIDTTDVAGSQFPNIEGLEPGPGFRYVTGNLLLDLVIMQIEMGKGGGSARQPVEDPNSLQSQATARLLDIISEGEIVGLVDGLKSVYFDGTPVENADGSRNFKGIFLEERKGLPDQDPIPDFPIENTQVVNVKVTKATPVVQTVSDTSISKLRVTLNAPKLLENKQETGDIKRTQVAIAIDLQKNGGGYTEVLAYTFDGKTTSGYQRSFDIALPPGEGPWDIRVRRITDDRNPVIYQDEIWWDLKTLIQEVKMVYPDTAMMALTVDAKQFGSDLPERAYLVYGIKVEVPSNYNPYTHTFTGVWDGTFKMDWTDDPVWIWRWFIVNKRFGLGRRITDANVYDKWMLYALSVYNNTQVNNGAGGTEERYSINTQIFTRREAYSLLNSIAATFRAYTFWTSGKVGVVQDRPAAVERLLTTGNAIEEMPDYSGGDLNDIYSVVIVSYNDTNDQYDLVPEVVEDKEYVQRFGWKPLEITIEGNTSRARAQRHGRWILDDQRYGSEKLIQRVGADFADVMPGTIVAGADPLYTTQNMGGRTRAATTTQVTVDKTMTLSSGVTYTLMIMMKDGTIEERVLTNAKPSTATVLTWSTPLATAPLVGGVWALKASNAAPRQWRVRGKKRDEEKSSYEITAQAYDPNRFARVEDGVFIEPVPYTDLVFGPLEIPSNLDVIEFNKTTGNAVQPAAQFSWSPVKDVRVVAYQAQVMRPGAFNVDDLGESPAITRELLNTTKGVHLFKVRSVDRDGRKSAWKGLSVDLDGDEAALPDITGLALRRDPNNAVLELYWNKPDFTKPIFYELHYNPTEDNFETATRLGVAYEERYAIRLAGHYYVRTKFMSTTGNTTHITITADQLLTLAADIAINADAILAEILQGAAHRAYVDLQLFINGQDVGTYVSTGIEEINDELMNYAAQFALLGAKNEGGTAWILNAATVKVTLDGISSTNFNTMVSTWNGYNATISDLSTVVNGQSARKALTIDVNGYITGYEWVNGGSPTTSAFTILTPNFYVVDPGNGLTTPRRILEYTGGVLKMANIEVDTVKALSIDTQQLKDHSVSDSSIIFQNNGGGGWDLATNATTSSGYSEIFDTDYDIKGGNLLILFTMLNGLDGGTPAAVHIDLMIDGSPVDNRDHLLDALFGTTANYPFLVQGLSVGIHDVKIRCRANRASAGTGGTSPNQVDVGWTKTLLMELKK